jgi:hypothetical protein
VDRAGPPAWTAHRAAASVGGGDDGAWLDGDAPSAMACDAAMATMVTEDVNPAALDDLVKLCVQLYKLRHGAGTGSDGTGDQGVPVSGAARAWEALKQAIIGKPINFLLHSESSSELRKQPYVS